MKTLRLIKFHPTQGVASRYWEDDGFRRNDTMTLADLTAEQQGIVSSALAWATSKLPAGMDSLESVELRKVADVAIGWSAPDVDGNSTATTFSPAFVAAIVGNGERGQSAIEISSEPGTVADGMSNLWEGLSE